MEQKRPAARVQQGFLHGAFILMFGVLLVKAIGALFKIPLSSIITEDGMGYFSTAYSFFNVLVQPFHRRFSRGSGMLLMPRRVAASATPCAWLPAEQAMTPFARSSADSWLIL